VCYAAASDEPLEALPPLAHCGFAFETTSGIVQLGEQPAYPRRDVKQALARLCPDVSPSLLGEFFTRMDRDYFLRFHPEVVGFDYFSELSILCGMLASFGLEIVSGDAYTFSRQPTTRPPTAQRSPSRRSHSPGAPRPMIVDVFHARTRRGQVFGPAEESRLEDELLQMQALAAQGRLG
jgi:hypothetical protein